jgi:hypothetical protein
VRPHFLLVAAAVLLIPRAEALEIAHVTSPIVVDGALNDAPWASIAPVTAWYEVQPGDNSTPKMRSEARLALDDHNLYIGYRFFDPDATRIRAPFAARDSLATDSDYGGVILDSQGDGRQAQVFYANPRGAQYDATLNDSTGDENPTPDFFWDAAARIDAEGWTLEMRIPLTTLRYSANSPRWRIALVRNFARDQRYRIYSIRIPRGSGCVLCHADVVSDLALPPAGAHFAAVPYAAARGASNSAALRRYDLGGDLKVTPSASTAIDLTLNPDFSQVESDTPQVSANQRFAIFYPEKRPFFLEGIHLFDTPLQLISTRTITAPDWGARATESSENGGYTVLVTSDRGGGSVIIPHENSSDAAPQDFRSRDVIARVKRNYGNLMLGGVLTDREVAGGGNNRVIGPDFLWRHGDLDRVSGELVFSQSRTPGRPDLAAEWDGRTLRSYAGLLIWRHTGPKWDWYYSYNEIGDDFRSDLGYTPQVGFREVYTNTGYTIRPAGALTSIRFYVTTDYQPSIRGNLLYHVDTTGADATGAYNSTFRVRFSSGRLLAGSRLIPRNQLLFIAQASPTRRFTLIGIDGSVGQQVDFTNARRGSGAEVHFFGSVQPLDRLDLSLDGNLSWIDNGHPGRVFTAQTERLRAAFAFSVASSLRVIVQNDHTSRSPLRYDIPVSTRSGSVNASILYQYKPTYATGIYVGAGDSRVIDEVTGTYTPPDRSIFMKMSYAFQR